MSDINTVISDFVNASINNGIALEDGNSNQANKYYRIIEKKINWLKSHNEISNILFSDLLNHPNDYVKYHASFALLHFKTDIALKTLAKLSEKQGLLGFSAEMIISEYKKGNI